MIDVYTTLSPLVLSIVTHWRGDFTKHDREWITANPGKRFLLFVRETGTNLVDFPETAELPPRGETIPYLFGHADREHIINGTTKVVRRMASGDPDHTVFYFDGRKIKRIDGSKAIELWQDHAEKLYREWE